MAELNSSSQKNDDKRSAKKLNPRVDLTAMVDLAFLLITFFMMATSLSKPRAMSLAMPVDGPSAAEPESRTLTICLGKNDRALCYMGMAEKLTAPPRMVNYNRTGLRETLIITSKQVLKRTGKAMIVILKPSPHSVYANLVSALDELEITRVPSYAIANISTRDKDLLKLQNAY